MACAGADVDCLSGAYAWAGDACVEADDGACRCVLPGEPVDVAVRTDLVASFAAYGDAMGDGVDVRRSRVMIYVLTGLFAACFALGAAGRLRDWRNKTRHSGGRDRLDSTLRDMGLDVDQRSYLRGQQHSALFERRKRTDTFWRTLKKTHPVFGVVFSNPDERAGRFAKTMKLGVELLIFAAATGLASALNYPDPGCADERRADGCLRYANDFFGADDRRMCAWDACSATCAYNKPSEEELVSAAGILQNTLCLALVVPALLFWDWLFDAYLIAPPPPAVGFFLRERLPAGLRPSKKSLELTPEPPRRDFDIDPRSLVPAHARTANAEKEFERLDLSLAQRARSEGLPRTVSQLAEDAFGYGAETAAAVDELSNTLAPCVAADSPSGPIYYRIPFERNGLRRRRKT